MGLYEDLTRLSQRIGDLRDTVETEEATKHSFVIPFLQALGYDIFDPKVVVPEFTADVGTKKGEKVDYAIMHDGIPMIIVEVKKHHESLDRHSSQLYRYFGTTNGKFALLTNGIEHRFFSDMDNQNRLDDSPFLVVDMLDLNKRDVTALERFTKQSLNIDAIMEMANRRKYILSIKETFENETVSPSDDLARLFASQVMPKGTRMTQSIVDDFKGYVKTAFSEIISDLASKKINSLRAGLTAEIHDEPENEVRNNIETTEEELQGFFIVKSILAESVPLEKLFARDTKSYFGVLYEDNNRKWIARLHFNTGNKYIGIHVDEKTETKFQLDQIEDIFKYKEELLNALSLVIG